MRTISIILLQIISLPIYSLAADTLILDLRQTIALAQKQSAMVRSARHTYLLQYWNHRSHCANYLPAVNISSMPYINNEINKITQGDGTSRFISQSQFGGDISINISQNIAITGGTLFMKSNINYLREMENKMNMFSTIPISIGYTQTILGYNSLKWSRRIEPLRFAEAKKNYSEALELVSVQACRYFFGLATAISTAQTTQANFANADTLYRMAQGRYKLGTITENEMLQLEIRRLAEETNAMDAQITKEEELQNFRSFLGLSQETPIHLILPDSVPQFSVPAHEALSRAIQKSPTPVYYERMRREARSNLAAAKADARLKADIYLQFGLSQTGTTLGNAYNRPMTQEYGSISITLPILDWGRGKGKIHVARSQQELTNIQAEQGMEDFKQNVLKLVSQFNMQARKVHIARLTEKRADHRHTVAMRLYIMGQNTLLDLNDAVAERDSARRSYLNAMNTFWELYYTLRSITGYDFYKQCEITEQLPIK